MALKPGKRSQNGLKSSGSSRTSSELGLHPKADVLWPRRVKRHLKLLQSSTHVVKTIANWIQPVLLDRSEQSGTASEASWLRKAEFATYCTDLMIKGRIAKVYLAETLWINVGGTTSM